MSLCRWNPKPTARDYTTLTFSELWKWFLSRRLKKIPFFSPTPIWKDLKNVRPQQWNCQQLWASFSARFEMRRNHCPCWGTTLVSMLHIAFFEWRLKALEMFCILYFFSFRKHFHFPLMWVVCLNVLLEKSTWLSVKVNSDKSEILCKILTASRHLSSCTRHSCSRIQTFVASYMLVSNKLT